MGFGGSDRFWGIFLGEGDAFHLVFHLVAEDVIALGDLVSARHNGNSIRNLRKREDALADADDDKLRKMGAVVLFLDGGMKHAVFDVVIYHRRGDKRLIVVSEDLKSVANEGDDLVDIKLESGEILPPRQF